MESSYLNNACKMDSRVQSKRVQKNIDRRTSPWIITITKGNKSNSKKSSNKKNTKSGSLAKPPVFLCAVPTVCRDLQCRQLWQTTSSKPQLALTNKGKATIITVP